jgi:hypothetical protein
MKRPILRAVFAFAVLLLVVYAADYCSLRYQLPGGRPQFGQVAIENLYAIQEKNGKTEYESGPPETDRCVHSLFPHYGNLPCWYVSRHREKMIDI